MRIQRSGHHRGIVTVIQWLLVDYGETISTPLPAETITDLAGMVGLPHQEFKRRYWQERPGYDLGQSPATYWSHVLDRDPDELASILVRLTRTDVLGWLHLNTITLQTVLAYARQTGVGLAVLSNAPEPLAAAIDRCRWSQQFTHRFYSARLRYAKPDPAAFTTVLSKLNADPRDVLFVDDNAANTLAAAELEMPSITFTSAAALGHELQLISASRR
jgi:putative hydrolase of the HAD superfamily